MKRRILILIGIPDFDYYNEKSAVVSFLNEIKNAFLNNGSEVEFAVDIPQKRNITAIGNGQGGMKGFLKHVLRKWPWFYQSMAYKSYFGRQDQIKEKLLKGKPFDHIVEFHTAGSTVGAELASLWKASFAVVFDSPVAEQFYEMHGTKTIHWKKIEASEKVTLEAADCIMAYSPACEDYIRKNYRISGKVSVLPCVITKERVENNPESKDLIGFIGSFLSWHKVELLLDVFRELRSVKPSVQLVLVGYGQEWNRIQKKVSKLGLTDCVIMPGFVTERELLEYKRKITVAVMPGSNWYGSPLKLFEYAQSQIPFIAPSTPTVTSIFENEKHCLYIEEENPEKSLLEKLKFLLENPEKAKVMAKAAKDYVEENFEEKNYADKLVKTLSTRD